MQYTKTLLSFLFLALVAISCGNGSKEAGDLKSKKAKLEKLLSERTKMDDEIRKLQDEIAKLEGKNENDANKTLVAITPVAVSSFDHYIDLRGKIDADNISYITPSGMGGQVKEIYIKEGDAVKKGQLLLKLDDAIMKQSVTAARQQLQTLKTQLSFAKTVYERQNNLWQKGIGTEIQLINARTNVETLENQLKGAEEQIKVGEAQLNTTKVYSDVDGIAETVMVKPGELFGGMGQIKIVNTSKLKVICSIPESYVAIVKKGQPVVVAIPNTDIAINSNITLVGQTIENTQRGFMAEAPVAYHPDLKPNQSAVVKILDYHAASAVVIPVNTIQSDETNKYVYVMQKQSNGKTVARRTIVSMGAVYGDKVEILSGLMGGESLITAGYQNLYEGQAVKTAN